MKSWLLLIFSICLGNQLNFHNLSGLNSTLTMVIFFFIVRNWSFFMGIIFCSSVALIWTFNTKSVYNFITKGANIPVNLVPFFNDVSFLISCFLKSGVTNELRSLFLWKSKKVRVIYSEKNFAAHKTLVWSTYVWRNATATVFLKKE